MTSTDWETLPYDAWQATCDTVHAHSQLLGKLAVALATPEPQLQHAALRLTARGWETMPLPAPDGSGVLVVVLDLQRHHTVLEHSDGRTEQVSLTPNRSVGEVSREVLTAVRRLVGPVEINPNPQEVSWSAPLDEDDEHKTYDAGQVANYFAAATRASLVLTDLRAASTAAGVLRSMRGGARSTLPSACIPVARSSRPHRASSCATPRAPSRSRSAGGPVMPATASLPSMGLRHRHPMGLPRAT